MSKELVVCDIDDVIAANAAGFVAWSNEHFGTTLNPDDYSEDFTQLWPTTDKAEIIRRAQLFHESGAISAYDHIDQAAVTLRALTAHYRFIAATSRRRIGEKYTRAWLEESYDGVFEELLFAGIYDDVAPTDDFHGVHLRTKADIYRVLRPDYVIDDQLKHCYAAAEQGIKTILFGNYKWNQVDELPPLITRCDSWLAVGEYLQSRVPV